LTSLFIYSPFPARIRPDIFESVDKDKCTLYVPQWSVNVYKQAVGWRHFIHVEKIPE
jgi:hypothetical protein